MHLPYYAKEESIGDPQLFCGRQKELEFFLQWADGIPKRLSKSRSLMAAKKMGKTALLERLYNILFIKQGTVIPFYFRVLEEKKWEPIFAEKFYCSFLTQYLAFKLNRPEWVDEPFSLEALKQISKKNQFDKIQDNLFTFEELKRTNTLGLLWTHAAATPHSLAAVTGDFFLQIIDEFQYLNHYIYADQNLRYPTELAGSYMAHAESKIAPLLVSGSYLGWLRKIVQHLISRFTQIYLPSFTVDESLAAIHRYAEIFNVELAEKSGSWIQNVTENRPFYISNLIRSIDFSA